MMSDNIFWRRKNLPWVLLNSDAKFRFSCPEHNVIINIVTIINYIPSSFDDPVKTRISRGVYSLLECDRSMNGVWTEYARCFSCVNAGYCVHLRHKISTAFYSSFHGVLPVFSLSIYRELSVFLTEYAWSIAGALTEHCWCINGVLSVLKRNLCGVSLVLSRDLSGVLSAFSWSFSTEFFWEYRRSQSDLFTRFLRSFNRGFRFFK